jgi:hypothetical protein
VIAGASVTLTCAVELSPAVDVPVTVNTEWTGPAYVIFMPVNPVPAVMVNISTYVSSISVGAPETGSYSCQANITSDRTTSGSTNITVGMHTPHCLPLSKHVHNIMLSLQPPSLLPLT